MVSKLMYLSLFFSFCWLCPLPARPGYFEPWGKDQHLSIASSVKGRIAKVDNPLSQAAEKLILFHQNVISPADGPRSHFRPTSSRYMLLAIRKFGFLNGFLKGCDRLLRENKDPWVYRTITIDHKQYKFDPASRS
jgi:putative component of membrane protein insertase Oxa1/YidC/SpoIIIJ protein YidD